MKVRQLLLENFRSYKQFTRIDFIDLGFCKVRVPAIQR